MVAAAQKIGRGIYSASEAALYARVRTQLLNRWIYHPERSVIKSDYGDEDRTISFLTFVEALAIRDITTNHGVSLQLVRKAHEFAKAEYDVKHPFAMKHRTFLYTEQGEGLGNAKRRLKERKELVIKLDGDRYVQVTGKERGNQMIAQLSELFMRDLTYDPDTDEACAYRPLTIGERSVLMDPDRRAGEPIVESCGYSAMTLYDAYHAEGGIANAARAYGVEEDEIALAIRYLDFLRPAAK